MTYPTYLKLDITYLGWRASKLDNGTPSLSFRTQRNEFWDKITMPAGNNLLDCEGFLHLYPSDDRKFEVQVTHLDGEIEKFECIGLLYHLPAHEGSGDGVFSAEDEKYTIECSLPEQQIWSLLKSIRSGESPQTVTATIVRGLDSGYVPDGSDKTWMDQKSSQLPVGNLAFLYEVDHGLEESDAGLDDDWEDELGDTDDPPVSPDASLERVLSNLTDIQSQLGWIVVGAIGAAIAALAIAVRLY